MANDTLLPRNGHTLSAAITTSAVPSLGNSVTTSSTTDPNYSEDLPCEKYRQFMDSSRQERTFMIEKLVETFANVIDSIWHPKFLVEHQKAKVMPTKGFCSEILKRSKTTYSTLQISLFYVFRVKKVVHEKLYQRIKNNSNNQNNNQSCSMQTNTQMDDLMCCGRRMFLASLMLASKYLHDKNYHNKAWAKITGLDIKEINAAEIAFLKLIDYRLYVSKPTFDKWYTQLHGHIQKGYKPSTGFSNNPLPSAVPAAAITSTETSITTTYNPPNNSMTNYPSPPLETGRNMDTNRHYIGQSQSAIGSLTTPITPPSQQFSNTSSLSENKYATCKRVDSGVSFDLLSSPSSLPTGGIKRPHSEFDDDLSVNKRSCQ